MDITIIHLDPQGDVANDCLYILEVKTTGQVTLNYASALIADYEKLLDQTNPDTSLGARVKWLKTKLKYEHKLDKALLDRVDDLYRPLASDCARIKLLPTLVHDRRYGDPIQTLGAVSDAISSQGWPARNIESQSIALRRLDDCLSHLAKLTDFVP
ncbi:hypothetical protein [Hydrogenophaga intermedia]|uniref:hypothetical protein n=1 Tax=Hydrogenophaga intermedia TaxID=65786 RepID=UPI00069130ED|nr:hypothetical protein [Hydrogenophaga intermedia]TMU70219.1 hypothetical protein FGJ01_24320 [Hydrogenophaga intermedia]